MSEPAWYLFALLPLMCLAGAHTAIDCWLANLPRPLPRRGRLVLAARWGFLAAVLIYAWLIDSHRVPYREQGIWLLFGMGLVLSVGLAAAVAVWVARPAGKGRKRGKKGKCP
jgi:hypothetical protein